MTTERMVMLVMHVGNESDGYIVNISDGFKMLFHVLSVAIVKTERK